MDASVASLDPAATAAPVGPASEWLFPQVDENLERCTTISGNLMEDRSDGRSAKSTGAAPSCRAVRGRGGRAHPPHLRFLARGGAGRVVLVDAEPHRSPCRTGTRFRRLAGVRRRDAVDAVTDDGGNGRCGVGRSW